MNKKRLKKYVLSICGIVFLAFLLSKAKELLDFELFLSELKSLNLIVCFGVCVAFILSRYFQAQRFRQLHSANLGKGAHFGISLTGQFVNALIPMRGGEVIRPYYLLKLGTNTNLKQIVMSTLIDKLSEGLSLLPLVFVTYYLYKKEISVLFENHLSKIPFEAISLIAVFTLAACLYVFIKKKSSALRLFNFIHLKGFYLSVFNGLLHWIFFVLGFVLIVGDLKNGLFLGIVVNFAAAVPIAPGSLGVFEGSYIWAVAQVNPVLSPEKALAQAVVLHFFFLFIPVIGGVFFLVKNGIPQKKEAEVLQSQTSKL